MSNLPQQNVFEAVKAAINQMADLIRISGRLKDAYSQGVNCSRYIQDNIPDLNTALLSASNLDHSLNLYKQMKSCSEKMIYTIERLKVAAETGKHLLSPQTPPSAQPTSQSVRTMRTPSDPQHHFILQAQKSHEWMKQKQLQIEREKNPTKKSNMRLELARNMYDQNLELKNLKSKIEAQVEEQTRRLKDMIVRRRERLKDRSISTKSENEQVISQILAYDQTARDETTRNLSELSDTELKNLICNVLSHEPHPLTAHLISHTQKYQLNIQQYINKYRQLLQSDKLQLAVKPVEKTTPSTPDDQEELFNFIWDEEIDQKEEKPSDILKLVTELQEHNQQNKSSYMKGIDGLLEAIYTTRDIFIFSYHKTEEPISDDTDLLVCKTIEEKMFELIGDQLLTVTRLLKFDEEKTLFGIMGDSSGLTLTDFEGDNRLLCGTNGEFLQPIVDKVRNLAEIRTPVGKLVTLGEIYEELNSTLQNQLAAHQIVKPLGADDIMPVVSLVIVKSGLTQISAELEIIEHFIHSYFENGKEEYTFCTFLTATSALTQSPI